MNCAVSLPESPNVVRTLPADPNNRVPHFAFQPDALTDKPILPMDEVETAYYLRMLAVDQPGVLADVTAILGNLDISIELDSNTYFLPGYDGQATDSQSFWQISPDRSVKTCWLVCHDHDHSRSSYANIGD